MHYIYTLLYVVNNVSPGSKIPLGVRSELTLTIVLSFFNINRRAHRLTRTRCTTISLQFFQMDFYERERKPLFLHYL